MLPTPAQAREPVATLQGSRTGPRHCRSPTKTLSGASVLSSVARELAHYIGPIAKVVVSRAAKQACTLDELYSLVSAEISTERERKAFMATRQKYSLEN